MKGIAYKCTNMSILAWKVLTVTVAIGDPKITWNSHDIMDIPRKDNMEIPRQQGNPIITTCKSHYLSVADPGINFGGAKPSFPIESWGRKPESRARSAQESRAKPKSKARASENWGRSPRKSGGGSSVSPSPENFWKIELETIHFGAYSIIRLYRTRVYRNSAYIEVQSAVPPDTMLINTKEARLYQNSGISKSWLFRSYFSVPVNQKPIGYIELK